MHIIVYIANEQNLQMTIRTYETSTFLINAIVLSEKMGLKAKGRRKREKSNPTAPTIEVSVHIAIKYTVSNGQWIWKKAAIPPHNEFIVNW